jgi:hypothetical protein
MLAGFWRRAVLKSLGLFFFVVLHAKPCHFSAAFCYLSSPKALTPTVVNTTELKNRASRFHDLLTGPVARTHADPHRATFEFLGDNIMFWFWKFQNIIFHSSAEAEYGAIQCC